MPLMMRYGSRYKGLGADLNFPWFSGDTPSSGQETTSYPIYSGSGGGTDWASIAGSISSAASNVTRSLTPLFAASSLQSGQSMVFNPTTGQYVISSGSLPLSLTSTGVSTTAISGWLPILGIGLVAVLGIKALSSK